MNKTIILARMFSEADKIKSAEAEILTMRNVAINKISKINKTLEEDLKSYIKDKNTALKSLEKMVRKFHKFLGLKVIPTNEYKFGLIRSTSIQINKDTIKLIEKTFKKKAEQYLHIIKNPDKNALRKLTKQQLKQIHANKIILDKFFIKFL